MVRPLGAARVSNCPRSGDAERRVDVATRPPAACRPKAGIRHPLEPSALRRVYFCGRANYLSGNAFRIAAGWSSPVARQAHNLKVIGSNPIPATKISPADQCLKGGSPGFFVVGRTTLLREFSRPRVTQSGQRSVLWSGRVACGAALRNFSIYAQARKFSRQSCAGVAAYFSPGIGDSHRLVRLVLRIQDTSLACLRRRNWLWSRLRSAFAPRAASVGTSLLWP